MTVPSGISLRMTWSTEQTRWLMKVLQPEQTVASLPGAAALTEPMRAALLGLAPDAYSAELGRLRAGAKEAARELLADPAVGAMVDRLPLRPGARVLAFGDSHTSDPQSWAVILNEMLAARRPADGISIDVSAVAGETTTHGLIRIGGVIARNPDWILFFIGVNDARTQGPTPSKTLVAPEETARNLAELRTRVSRETKARCLWVTPAPVLEDRVSKHWGLSRFGVRFRNEDIARVAEVIAAFDEPAIELFARLGLPPPQELLMEDGLHFTQEGQKRIALEVVRGWADARAR
ncbi:SGNH/GDSL hydrolase family protein [Myxococcus sp. CA039A]|uniref:SGNH/GDSL hydrolase family protein n=1 Tax=Myxococcus sp. CA039A TaxID=2741737 RepID=UPI00359CA495